MKLFSLLFFLIVTIQYIQSGKTLRTYIVERDNPIRERRLSAYTIYDSTGKNILYQLKSTSTDIDTLILRKYPAKNIVANLEGEWVVDVFNVTFSIYDKKSTKWIDGTIKQNKGLFKSSYLVTWDAVTWNSKYMETGNKFFSDTLQVFSTSPKVLLAEIRKRTPWFSRSVKFYVKIYSDLVPDAIYFFLMAIKDHRKQLESPED
jgi:hypothetical protein